MSDEAEVRIFPFRITGTSNAANHRTVLAQILGVGAEGDSDGSEPASDCEVWTPIGFASRPSIPSSGNKVTGLAIQVGDAIHVLHVRDKSLATLADSDLAAGDAIMYAPGAPACTIKLDANGAITVTAKDGQALTLKGANSAQIQMDANGAISVQAATGQGVTLQGASVTMLGGSTSVAKEGSQTTGHMHTLSGSAGPYPLAGTAVTTTDSIASGAGSANVKVP